MAEAAFLKKPEAVFVFLLVADSHGEVDWRSIFNLIPEPSQGIIEQGSVRLIMIDWVAEDVEQIGRAQAQAKGMAAIIREIHILGIGQANLPGNALIGKGQNFVDIKSAVSI